MMAGGGSRLIAIREIRRIAEEKGGNDADAQLIARAYHALDHLAGGLFTTKARSQELEKKSQEYEATVRAKEQTFRDDLECQEMIHHQAIADVAAERDHTRELLLKRDEEVVRLGRDAEQLEDSLKKEKARTVIDMKHMEILACREQESELRDQLQEAIAARAAVEAHSAVIVARDETIVLFQEEEVPRIREAAITEFRKGELPALLASAADIGDTNYALGQAEYRSWVLHYFG